MGKSGQNGGWFCDDEIRALFALADPLKPTAKDSIDALTRQGCEL